MIICNLREGRISDDGDDGDHESIRSANDGGETGSE